MSNIAVKRVGKWGNLPLDIPIINPMIRPPGNNRRAISNLACWQWPVAGRDNLAR